MPKIRILVIANKEWEVHPLLDVLLNPRFQPPAKSFLPTEFRWRFRYGEAVAPRAVLEFERVSVEVWCIADHMNPDKSASSSEEKNRIMPGFFRHGADPGLVIAFGTGSASPGKFCNGSVFAGGQVFSHDGHPVDDPNRESAWRYEKFDQLLPVNVPPGLFDAFGTFKCDAEKRMLDVPVNPSPPSLFAQPNFVAVSTVNVTRYEEYADQDTKTIAALRKAKVSDPIGSVETTHGVIRAQSEAPFLFITGIPNRFAKFDVDMSPKPEAQNYAAGFNAGIVVAFLLPALDAFFG